MAYDKLKNVYHISRYEANIKGAKLLLRSAICFFLYDHNKLNLTIKESATKKVEKEIKFWDKARIPTRYEYMIA